MEKGQAFTINKTDYLVLETCGNFALLLNVMEDEKDNSGDIILVEIEKKNKVKIVTDEALIKSLLTHMLEKVS